MGNRNRRDNGEHACLAVTLALVVATAAGLLSGCIVAPAPGPVYYAPAPVVVAPAPVVVVPAPVVVYGRWGWGGRRW